MRFHVFNHSVMCVLALAVWTSPVRAERSSDNFPDTAVEEQPAPRHSLPLPPPERPAPTASPRGTQSVAITGALQRDQDTNAAKAKRVRQQWLLSAEATTHAPIDMGAQVGVETPQGLRLFGGYGVVPGTYMSLLTGIAANASGNSYARALLDNAKYTGHTWRVQAGWRPFRAIGLYGDVGYARLSAKGALDLASSGIPMLAALGGGYEANTRLDMWLIELGYQGELADRLVLGLALGCMGTFNSTTTIASVNGAPSSSAILGAAATQTDTALEKYGFVPTLTLRLGFDLI
jgi:hypothetical protein